MKFYCPQCSKSFDFAQSSSEQQISCPRCGKKYDKPAEPGPGVVIGDFLIEKLISRGGMGEVFLARQLSLDRPVALKVLQKEFNNDREYVDSLFHEARAAAKINHPNIVQAYMVGEEEGIYYFAMEYIRGETFKKILKEKGVIDFVTAAKVIRDVAGALDVAWREQKLVHQDIKPDNIMVDVNGFTKLADLGLAKTAGMDTGDEDSDEVLGTPQYISPEQLTGIPTDVRSDLYSLGATFYHFVTGHFAYEAPTAEEITRMHVDGNLTPPQKINPRLPDALNAIIVKMMARKIEDRYQEPAALISDLNRFLRKAESAAPKISLVRNGNSDKSVVPPPAEPPKTAVPKLSAPKAAVPKLSAPKAAVPKLSAPKAAVPKLSAPKAAVLNPVAEQSPVPGNVPANPAGGLPAEPASPKKKFRLFADRRQMIRWSCWGGGSFLALLLVAVIVGCILERMSKVPHFLAPPLQAINDAIDQGLGAARDKALEMAKQPETPAVPEPDHKTVETRQEYLARLNALIEWIKANPDKKKEFVEKVDREWLYAVAVKTPEERKKLEELAVLFAVHEEEVRCRAAREELKRSHEKRLADIDAKHQAEAERRKQAQLEAEKAKEAEAEKARQEAERIQKAEAEKIERERRIAAKRAAEERERQRLVRIEINKINTLIDKIAQTTVAAVISDRDADLKAVLELASEYQPPKDAGNEVARKTAQLRKFGADSLTAFVAAREYRGRLGKIGPDSNIRVMFSNRSALVISVKQDGILCRNTRDGHVFLLDLSNASVKTRNSLYKALRRKKFEHPVFFLALLSGKFDADAKADLPEGYWRDNWSLLEKYIR